MLADGFMEGAFFLQRPGTNGVSYFNPLNHAMPQDPVASNTKKASQRPSRQPETEMDDPNGVINGHIAGGDAPTGPYRALLCS